MSASFEQFEQFYTPKPVTQDDYEPLRSESDKESDGVQLDQFYTVSCDSSSGTSPLIIRPYRRYDFESPIPKLSAAMVKGVVAPADWKTRPIGAADTGTAYFYNMTEQYNVPDYLVGAVKLAEDYMFKEAGLKGDALYVTHFRNQSLASRTLALIAEAPPTIDQEIRFKAWKALLDEDWVHAYTGSHDLNQAIAVVAEAEPTFARRIIKAADRTYQNKVGLLSIMCNENLGVELDDDVQLKDGRKFQLKHFTRENFDFELASEVMAFIEANLPEWHHLSLAITSLAAIHDTGPAPQPQVFPKIN